MTTTSKNVNLGKTQGHGNPNWTREETILALELYLKHIPRIPGKTDSEVIALSNTLQTLPYHSNDQKKQRFRNPAGVAFKLLNLNAARTGKGLTNISQLDRKLWNAYGSNPKRVTELANAIRDAVAIVPSIAVSEAEPTDAEDYEATEGRILGRLHRVRERAKGLRSAVIKKALKKSGRLECEACGFTPGEHLGEAAESAFEVHHLLPLHAVGETRTRLSDVALLCAVCHRLIHRISSLADEWQTVASFQKILKC